MTRLSPIRTATAGAQPPYTSPYGPGFKASVGGEAYIDEGHHGWRVLRRGKTFDVGRFRCRRRPGALRCAHGGRFFTVDAEGRPRRG